MRKVTLRAPAVLLAATLLLAPATAGGKGNAAPMRLATSNLFIEINATDGDAGLQLQLDAEKWNTMRIVNPKGATILDVSGSSSIRGYGITGLTFESAEPPFRQFPFSQFKARFPAGTYRFSGTTVGGRRLVGTDRLTHRIPAKPVIVAPAEDARVSTRGLVVRWRKVTRPRGIRIVQYQVIVTQQQPERVLDLTMPPTATAVSIPPEFLELGKEYALEVLAREASGNQVITEITFRTT